MSKKHLWGVTPTTITYPFQRPLFILLLFHLKWSYIPFCMGVLYIYICIFLIFFYLVKAQKRFNVRHIYNSPTQHELAMISATTCIRHQNLFNSIISKIVMQTTVLPYLKWWGGSQFTCPVSEL